MLQNGWTISESQTFGKLKVEAWPFGKELDAATPRRHRTGIGPLERDLLGGSSLNRPYKAVGRRSTVEDGQKAGSFSNGPFGMDGPFGSWMDCLKLNGQLGSNGPFE